MSAAYALDFHNRHYDPEVGRFIQSDPHPGELSNPLTYINKYIYVLNNPINSTDPLGLFSLGGLFRGVVNTVKKVMSNKVAGLIISTVVAGPIGTLAYINMSGQFHPKDVALVNTIAIAAAAVATGGAAGSAIGFAAGGGVSGMVAGAVAGAVVGGITGGFVGGALSALGGGSFVDGFVSGAVTGMVAGGLAGAYMGYTNPYFSNAPKSAGFFDFLDGCIGGAATAGVGLVAAAAGYALIPMTGGASIVIGWWAAGAIGGGALVGAGAKGASACL